MTYIVFGGTLNLTQSVSQSFLFVAGGVQEQSQDVLVLPLLRNCLTPNDTFLFSVITSLQYSGPCNSVNCLGRFKMSYDVGTK